MMLRNEQDLTRVFPARCAIGAGRQPRGSRGTLLAAALLAGCLTFAASGVGVAGPVAEDGTSSCTGHGAMMHSGSMSMMPGGHGISRDENRPTVIVSRIETWHEYRHKTDQTYVDAKGETQPRYEMLRPEVGNVYLHVVIDVATPEPRSWKMDEVLLVDTPNEDPQWEAAPIVRFDEKGIPVEATVTAPSQKLALNLMYEVPEDSWRDDYLRIGNRWYGPLDHYVERMPIDSAGNTGH